MVEVHTINCGHVNCYIVVDNGKAILIDTGMELCWFCAICIKAVKGELFKSGSIFCDDV